MSKEIKGSRGGKRPFSGRKKATYKTQVIAFRVREEIVDDVKRIVKEYVSEHAQNINS